jgi:hypothetical protein
MRGGKIKGEGGRHHKEAEGRTKTANYFTLSCNYLHRHNGNDRRVPHHNEERGGGGGNGRIIHNTLTGKGPRMGTGREGITGRVRKSGGPNVAAAIMLYNIAPVAVVAVAVRP